MVNTGDKKTICSFFKECSQYGYKCKNCCWNADNQLIDYYEQKETSDGYTKRRA